MTRIDCTLKLIGPTDPNVRATDGEPCAMWDLTMPVDINTTAHKVYCFVEQLLSNYFNLNHNTFSISCAPDLIVWERDSPYILNKYDYTHMDYILRSFHDHDMYSDEQVITIAMNNTEHRAIVEDVINNPNVGPINYWYPINDGSLHIRIIQIRDAPENIINNNINNMPIITSNENNMNSSSIEESQPGDETDEGFQGECPVCFETCTLHNHFSCTHGLCRGCHESWNRERSELGHQINCPMCRATSNNNIQNSEPSDEHVSIAQHLIQRLQTNIERIDYIINNRNREELTTIYNTHNFMNESIDRLESVFVGYPPDLD
tara:strand:- start:1265 stop:2221 length:957 start_codon:yes stop_codon:yes gene_type:complete